MDYAQNLTTNLISVTSLCRKELKVSLGDDPKNPEAGVVSIVESSGWEVVAKGFEISF